jgi:hypothetical protein
VHATPNLPFLCVESIKTPCILFYKNDDDTANSHHNLISPRAHLPSHPPAHATPQRNHTRPTHSLNALRRAAE